jgi:hypothetical protein
LGVVLNIKYKKMKILGHGLLCALSMLAFPAMAQDNKYELQSCINIEYANVIANAPTNISTGDGYKRGYSQGFEFIPFYEKKLRSLPNPEVDVPEILGIATEAGSRMAKNLSKDQIAKAMGKCRGGDTSVIQKKPYTPSDASLIERIKPLAATVNSVWTDGGMFELANLTDSCYRAIISRSYDCLIVDAASMFINSLGPSPSQFEFFGRKAHSNRLANAIENGQFRDVDINRIDQMLVNNVKQALLDDLKDRKNEAVIPCIIVDPDISTHYSGECINNFANGFGIARGRDEYKGEFKNGMTHGYGSYTWGSQSRWATEEYNGWYYKGEKMGFGHTSISSLSNHPSLESMKKYGNLNAERYHVTALYKAGKIVKHCASEADCSKFIFTYKFPELDDLIEFGFSPVPLAEVERLTNMAIYRPDNFPAKVSDCITQELTEEFFGKGTKNRSISSTEIQSYRKFLGVKKMVDQVVLYCIE